MRVGDTVEYINKTDKEGKPRDKKYVVYGFCRMKNPTTREWVDAVQYMELGNIKSSIYVREKQDFESHFKLV